MEQNLNLSKVTTLLRQLLPELGHILKGLGNPTIKIGIPRNGNIGQLNATLIKITIPGIGNSIA